MTYRSVFLSDVHLGNRGCQAELLANFLRRHPCENLFLVGDIVDFEAMEASFYWHESHSAILKAILAAARRGTRVTYIPGNHDERMRVFCGRKLGPVHVERFAWHSGADGRRYLLLHGDEFDGLLGCAGVLARIGAAAYRTAIRLNTQVNRYRRRWGYGYLPLATRLKHRVGSARQYMDQFRDTVTATARGLAVDGVICGHIHRPEVAEQSGLTYMNTGDWVENCSALVEHADGRIELVRESAPASAAVRGLEPARAAA